MLADTAVGAALCALFLIMVTYVPLFSPFALFITGTPLMYLVCKRGIVSGISALVCAMFVTFFITGNVLSAALMAVVYALPGLAFGIVSAKNRKFSVSLTVVTAAVLLGLMLELVMINGGGDGIRSMITESTDSIEHMLSKAIPDTPETANITSSISVIMNQIVDIFMLYLPAIVIMGATVYAYAISAFGVFFLKRMRVKSVHYKPFYMLHAPRGMCIAAILLFIVCRISDSEEIYMAALKNLSIVLTVAVGVCGFSFVDNAFRRGIPSGYVRAVIYASAWFVGFMLMSLVMNIFVILGFIDGFADFRRSERTGDD